MAKILILGDIHGNVLLLQDVIRNAVNSFEIDYVIQVGDFGFCPQVSKNMSRMKGFPVPVYAIDGNHEKHSWLHENKKLWKVWESHNNLIFCPRGTTIRIDGRLIVFVGGAMNVDRPQEGSIDKRNTNYLLNSEADEIAETLNKIDDVVDLMVTHSCPHSIGVGIEGEPMFIPMIHKYIIDVFNISVGPLTDCGEEVLTSFWNQLNKKPLNWVFGHFHKHKYTKVNNTNFWCVGCADTTDIQQYCIPYIYDTKSNVIEKIQDQRI